MPGDEDKSLIWVTIEDFTPGIITNSQLAYERSQFGSTAPVPGNKAGQAQAAVGCIALPNGGLGPLPAFVSSIGSGGTPNSGSFINGLFSVGPLTSGSNIYGDDVFYGELDLISGSTHWSLTHNFFAGGAGTILLIQSETGGSAGSGWATLTGDTTSVDGTISGLAWQQSTIAIAYWNPGGATQGFIFLYPNPSLPSTNTPAILTDTSIGQAGVLSDVLTHQNRIVGLGAQVVHWGSVLNSLVNELFDYTDPPNSITYGAQNETFIAEHPFGHGTWGSINASELFLVKHTGGGYFIEGDLNNPTVIRLPGVMSTYGLMSRGVSSPIGFVYASQNRGLWAWQGGQTSVKISEALDDDFFVNPAFASLSAQIIHGPTVDCRQWGDWVIVTNDWLLDTNTGGWWQLPPGSTANPHVYYAESSNGQFLFASNAIPTALAAIDVYDRVKPATVFSWTSYPIRLTQGSKDRNYSVQSVVLRVQGRGTVQVTLTGVGGATSSAASSPSATLTFNSSAQPQMLAMRTGITAQDVTIEVVSTGDLVNSTPAPVIYSIALGYNEQNPVSAT